MMPRSTPLVRFDEVTKWFDSSFLALSQLSFEIRAGEFVTFVGPSGCGKSTLLRIAAGLDEASSGSVEVDRSRLAYVFQDASLIPWRTVQGNVELLSELSDQSRAERRRAASEAIELVGLDGFEDAYPATLSGGMRMRTSLARSLTLEPNLFLFDEPFSALDEITRQRLNIELLSFFQTQQFGALFITHSVTEAIFLSTRVIILASRPGRIIGELPVPFPYPRPAELRYEPDFARLCSDVSERLRISIEAET